MGGHGHLERPLGQDRTVQTLRNFGERVETCGGRRTPNGNLIRRQEGAAEDAQATGGWSLSGRLEGRKNTSLMGNERSCGLETQGLGAVCLLQRVHRVSWQTAGMAKKESEWKGDSGGGCAKQRAHSTGSSAGTHGRDGTKLRRTQDGIAENAYIDFRRNPRMRRVTTGMGRWEMGAKWKGGVEWPLATTECAKTPENHRGCRMGRKEEACRI